MTNTFLLLLKVAFQLSLGLLPWVLSTRYFSFLKFIFLIDGLLLYRILLVSAKQQHESTIDIPMSSPS